MGIFSTAAIIAVIAILVAGALFLLFTTTSTAKLTAQQAESLVVNDIKAQNPDANVTVISVSNSTLAKSSWQIVTSVVYNGSKPCPSVQIKQFNYPATGLQSSDYNEYSMYNSTGCYLLGYTSAPFYVISLPQIAIARSYSTNNTIIDSYVNRFGYQNTFVTAKFITQGSSNSPELGNDTNVWLIKYGATPANYSVYAVLNQSGSILQTYNSSG
jgi:hypothetical protein